MKVSELIEELERIDQNLPVIVPTDIANYKFYDVEGISLFGVDRDGKEIRVVCLSRCPSFERAVKMFPQIIIKGPVDCFDDEDGIGHKPL